MRDTYVDDANMFTNPAYYEAYQNGKYIDWVDELRIRGLFRIIVCRFQEVQKIQRPICL